MSVSAFAPSPIGGVLRQGEVLAGVIQVHLGSDSLEQNAADVSIEEVVHPYALILTQDCDLDWDYKARTPAPGQQAQDEREENRRRAKIVPNILFCELATAESLRPRLPGSDVLRRIRTNQDERYHCFPAVSADLDRLDIGLPELVADFKRVFTIPTDELYVRLQASATRRSVLQPPFLQHLSTRFGYFCLRVALPEPKSAGAVLSAAPLDPPPPPRPGEP